MTDRTLSGLHLTGIRKGRTHGSKTFLFQDLQPIQSWKCCRNENPASGMTSNSMLTFIAALSGGVLALASAPWKRRSPAGWCFFAGMGILAMESALCGVSMKAVFPDRIAFWQSLGFLAAAFFPGVWLWFSLSYSRGNSREWLAGWRLLLIAAFLLPAGLSLGFHSSLIHVAPRPDPTPEWWIEFGPAARAVTFFQLLATILILTNLENTFRSAVGIMRWRIKFFILGLAVVFGARIYTQSQALLFSGHSLSSAGIGAGALIIGSALMVVGYLRSGFSGVEVYPSKAVLQTSVTVLLAGGYLLVVGVLSQIIVRMGGAKSFQFQAFLILLGIAGLAVLLLSDRFRQGLQRFISRHFKRPQYDVRNVWTLFTRRISSVMDEPRLCDTAAKMISEVFNVLSVTIWLADEPEGRLKFGASTSRLQPLADVSLPAFQAVLSGLLNQGRPFDLERATEEWAAPMRRISLTQFPKGGHRIGVPLIAGERVVGVGILADRVSGMPYTIEEFDLLKCIGDQFATEVLNITLANQLMTAKELEAFQTMSAFFVHDLKNAASGLNLMLQNLPVHFDDPAFREDALRGISSTATRINRIISRLSALRSKLELRPVESDLNQLVTETLEGLNGMPEIEVEKALQPVPKILADREQFQNVVTNLLFNARDAAGKGGRVRVETSRAGNRVLLAVTDNGCGMSPLFLARSLFRPFQTTKKQGLGIGMFESKMIVEAHGGNIQVESEPGKGTTFRVSLPLQTTKL